MSAKTIISARTAAVAAAVLVDLEGLRGEYNIMATGLALAETVDIELSPDNGASGEDAFQNGIQVQLTATNNITKVTCPIFLRVTKTAKAANSGVFAFIPIDIQGAP